MEPIVENGKELVGQSLEKAALMELNRIEVGITDLKEKYSGLVADAGTTEGMDTLSKARAAIRAVRYKVPKIVEDTTRRLNNLKKSIQVEGERIEKELHLIEDPIHAQIKAEDDRKAAEKEAEKQREETRRAAILDRMNAIAAIPATAINLSTVELQELIRSTVALPITGADFQEFLSKAESVRENTLGQLRSILFKVAELEAQRSQMEKERAVREEKEAAEREKVRLEQEAVAARLEAMAQRLRAEKAEQDRLAAEREAERQKSLEAEQAKMAAAKAQMDKEWEEIRESKRQVDDAIAESNRRADAELAERERTQREAEDKADAEAAEVARLQAEKEAVEKAEAEEAERLAREAEAAQIRAEFEEKVKDINYAMRYIYQMTEDPQPNPWETIQKIREIAGKFVSHESANVQAPTTKKRGVK